MKKILLLLLFLFSDRIPAQTIQHASEVAHKPFILGVTDVIWSPQLSENRTLNIYLPDGYDTDVNKSYPVIYLLDGSADEDFIHIVGIVQFLNMIGTMPSTIVVGIANVDRRRDLTFPTTIAKDKKDYPTTGGSEKFMAYIEKDLEPYIRKKYRVDSSATIIGQSLGGLFATEVLLKKPWLFSQYIIVSPSLWWDKESLLAKAPGLLKSFPAQKTIVYVSVGSEGKVMEGDAHKLVATLQQLKSPGMRVLFSSEPKENHLTILHNSIYKALERLNEKKVVK